MKKIIYVLTTLILVGCQTPLTKFDTKDDLLSVTILGEFHQRDREEIFAYLQAKKPDLVLLELPMDLLGEQAPKPEVLEELEKLFIGWTYCMKEKVTCKGFDMQGVDLFNIETQLPQRQEVFFKRLLEKMKETNAHLYKSLLTTMEAAETCGGNLRNLNTKECDDSIRKKRLDNFGHSPCLGRLLAFWLSSSC